MRIIGKFVKKILPWKKVKDCCTLWWDGVWQDCCCQHDNDYEFNTVPKQQADKDLRDCVISSGHPRIAKAMYCAVSIFGWVPWHNHRYREKGIEEDDGI